MSHLQHHHHQQHSQYVHYTGPPVQVINNNAGVQSSQDIPHQPQQNHQQQQGAALTPSSSTPLVATGDWTKDLIHLAKTAELKYVYLLLLRNLRISCPFPLGIRPDSRSSRNSIPYQQTVPMFFLIEVLYTDHCRMSGFPGNTR